MQGNIRSTRQPQSISGSSMSQVLANDLSFFLDHCVTLENGIILHIQMPNGNNLETTCSSEPLHTSIMPNKNNFHPHKKCLPCEPYLPPFVNEIRALLTFSRTRPKFGKIG